MELITLAIRRRHDAVPHLDGEHGGVDRAEDLLNLTHLGLVLQEDWTVEIRHLFPWWSEGG